MTSKRLRSGCWAGLFTSGNGKLILYLMLQENLWSCYATAWKQVHDLTPEKGREAREYIGVKNEGIFHFSDNCESDVKEGDYVRIETFMEEDGFLIVTHIEILE